MKRFLISSALMTTCLLACGGGQPAATTPSQPEAQQPTPEEENAGDGAEAANVAEEEKAPEPAEPPMHQGPSAWEGEGVGAWIADVVALQKERGQEIRVKVPLVIGSDGWGCMCPRTFIGVDPDSHAGGDTWITVDASGLPAPEQQRLQVPKSSDEPYRGVVYIVEGYFPGTRTKVDLRNKRGRPKEWLYQTWDLRVTAVLDTATLDDELFVYAEHAVDDK